uniref:U2 small nuclear ribonucleoprotein B'' isoform X1 n=1 Tax=Erigeron canadensis TaxID=72917 RepID=UPI001CB9C2E6|nr:U2 small nuclear ribonucleoprotein B'' isoform X1 [Erigeron canadensis]
MAIPHSYDPLYYNLPTLPPPEYSVYDDPNAINTLFVSGLPDDVKAREIHNLFRRRPGFDYCQLKYTGRGNQVVAFATFVNHQSAMAALHALNGVKFDPQTGSTLHIELARSNSRRKNKPGPDAYVVIDNRSKATKDNQESSYDGNSESEEAAEPDQHTSTKSSDDETAVDPDNTGAAENEQEQDQTESTVDGACSTLFIANLGPNCTEAELRPVVSKYPGFNTLKVRNRGGMPVAFADYEEVEQATEVMNSLQGTTLPSSDRGGMHIEYARSKMRKR